MLELDDESKIIKNY